MSIQIGQIVLIIALILFIVYVYRLRSVLLERVIYLACALAGMVLVIAPELSTRIANLLGIGRGRTCWSTCSSSPGCSTPCRCGRGSSGWSSN